MNKEIKNKLDDIKEIENTIARSNMKYKLSAQLYNFQKFQVIRSFGDSIFSGKITTNEADEKQRNLLNKFLDFNSKARPKSKISHEGGKRQYL